MNKKLGEVCHFYSGTGFPVAYQGKDSGELPFFKVSDIANNVSAGNVHLSVCNNYVSRQEASKLKGTILPKGTVVFAKIGEALKLNRRAITVCDCLVDNNAMGIAPDPDFLREGYFFYFMKKLKLQDHAETTTVPSVRKSKLELINISVPSIEKQEKIERELDKVSAVVQLRQKELQKLDDLIKARFVEMFGDPVHNTSSLPVVSMTEVCEIIDGDRGKNYPKQEDFFDEEYCLFLNAKNVTIHGFDFSECMFITKEKDEALRKGKLKRGDVVLTTRGTLGNLAFYTNDVPFDNVRINSGMVILRMNRHIIDEGFFIEQFRMQIDNIKQTVASGSAQPQLPISTMNKISVIMPDLRKQKQFASFVAQVDKSKIAVQKSLDETQLLFDSLMQQYFG